MAFLPLVLLFLPTQIQPKSQHHSFCPKYFSSLTVPPFQTQWLPGANSGASYSALLLQHDPKACHPLLRKQSQCGSRHVNTGPCIPATCLPFVSTWKSLSLVNAYRNLTCSESPSQRPLPP